MTSASTADDKFRLHDHWPRKSLVNHRFPYDRQPWRILYQLYYSTTFPLRTLLLLVPRSFYQRFLDKRSPSGRSWLDTLSVLIGRSLIDDLWMPTGGGMRGFHLDIRTSKKARLRYRKKAKAMPEVLQPTLRIDQLKEPVRSWAERAKATVAKDLTVWWLGQRSNSLVQEKAKSDEKILLYFSGGGYLVGTAMPHTDLGSLSMSLFRQMEAVSQKTPSARKLLAQSIIALEYRRTGMEPTPGALLDALSTYYHLVHDLGFQPNNISLMGDSAGGHLVNSLVRYLVEGSEEKPGKIVLISPWGDQAGTTIENADSSFQQMLPYDFLSDFFYHYCKDYFARMLKDPVNGLLDVYFSPAAVLGMVKGRSRSSITADKKQDIVYTKETEKEIFQGWPSTLVVYGKYEILKDQAEEIFRRLKLAKEAEGQSSRANVAAVSINTCHDPFVMPFFVFSKERREGIKQIVDWLAL